MNLTNTTKNISNVEFRFSQRIGDDTTAHETGIFIYTTSESDGKNKVQYRTHFEMLLVKRDGKWLGVMEYQKSDANEEEWDAMKEYVLNLFKPKKSILIFIYEVIYFKSSHYRYSRLKIFILWQIMKGVDGN